MAVANQFAQFAQPTRRAVDLLADLKTRREYLRERIADHDRLVTELAQVERMIAAAQTPVEEARQP